MKRRDFFRSLFVAPAVPVLTDINGWVTDVNAGRCKAADGLVQVGTAGHDIKQGEIVYTVALPSWKLEERVKRCKLIQP